MTPLFANALGVLALVFWSMSVAVTRHVAEANAFGMPGLSYCAAGVLLILLDRLRGTPPPWRSDASWRFWVFGGGAFSLYLLFYAGGLAWSDSRSVVLPLGLVNYFWPCLILFLMPLFFPCRMRWPILIGGAALCVAGAGAAFLWGMTPAEMVAVVVNYWPAFLLVLAAAVLWALYSNIARKWGGTANGTGWFMLAAGVAFLVTWGVTGGDLGFRREMLLPFVLHAAVVNAAAYLLWDYGVRRGDIALMGSLANLLPIASIVFGIWYLGETATPGLWLGCVLVTVGAVLCRKGAVSTNCDA